MKRLFLIFLLFNLITLTSLSSEEKLSTSARNCFELGFSHLLRPSFSWTREQGTKSHWYYGALISAQIVPFPINNSQSNKETCITYFTFYPEASLFFGGLVSAFDFLDFKMDLNFGGDAFLQYSTLKIPEYNIDKDHLAWAITPWAWVRPAVRFNPGPLFHQDWLSRLSAEVSAIVALGSPLFIDERLRLEISVFWRL